MSFVLESIILYNFFEDPFELFKLNVMSVGHLFLIFIGCYGFVWYSDKLINSEEEEKII